MKTSKQFTRTSSSKPLATVDIINKTMPKQVSMDHCTYPPKQHTDIKLINKMLISLMLMILVLKFTIVLLRPITYKTFDGM
jgi:hypothetical protein